MSSAGKFERLGKVVAARMGNWDDPEGVLLQREAFLSLAVSDWKPARRGRRLGWVAAFAAVAAVAVIAVFWFMTPRKMSFWIGAETTTGEEGQWLKTAESETVPLRFEDGTHLEIASQSAAKIVRADKQHVEIELGAGTIKASINKQTTRADWTIQAGGYRVTALGTVFEVNWRPDSSLLVVKVLEGSVVLHGEGVQKQGIVVPVNRKLTMRREGEWTVTKIREDRPKLTEETAAPHMEMEMVEPPDPENAEEPAKPAGKTETKRVAPVAPGKKDAKQVASLTEEPVVSWQEYYDSRMYQEVLAEAERRGLPGLYESLDDRHLWQLANSARYVKRAEVAMDALKALRRRFPDSSNAPVAVFLLGRISSDTLRDHQGACNWFQVYLQEYPGGKLTGEALGRSIDSCRKAGMKHKAVEAAKRYLKEYPEGSYSNLATSVLPQ